MLTKKERLEIEKWFDALPAKRQKTYINMGKLNTNWSELMENKWRKVTGQNPEACDATMPH